MNGSASSAVSLTPQIVIDRYALYHELAAGGMATVHLARLMGPVGFSRTVAVKRLHAHFVKDPDFASMFIDEARLAARIRHPNVVQALDVVTTRDELFLVMEYVAGETFSRCMRAAELRGERAPQGVALAVVVDALRGLHAAHTARSERGEPLGIVHRDVSPQNILIGTDGVAHVLDFGVAKAVGRLQTTMVGQIKGKIAYMAPEQFKGDEITCRADIFAAGVILWEALTGRRLFKGQSEARVLYMVLDGGIPKPSTLVEGISPQLERIVMKSLAAEPSDRFETALEMGDALEAAAPLASSKEVATWLERVAHDALEQRSRLVEDVESITSTEGARSVTARGIAAMRRASVSAKNDVEAGQFGAPDLPTVTSHSASIGGRRTARHFDRRLAVLIGAPLGLLVAIVVVMRLVSTATPVEGVPVAPPAGRVVERPTPAPPIQEPAQPAQPAQPPPAPVAAPAPAPASATIVSKPARPAVAPRRPSNPSPPTSPTSMYRRD